MCIKHTIQMTNKTTAQAIENRTMLTDLYQFTMNAAYFDNNKNEKATFDLFIRKLPRDWGYFIANGIEDAVDYATNIRFDEKDINYLGSQNLFKKDFLNYKKDFKFTGDIYAVKEGTPITANAPLIRVTAPRMEAQFLETILLNTANFQTMIASKANRVVNAAYPASVSDYGLRRAQDQDAAMKGARATYIAGCVGTSNVRAGMEYGIPIKGTHAHSFVKSFPTELEAFKAYVKTFPDNAILLIDTYDTLNGAGNAAIVAKELEKAGHRLLGVRIDSEDLAMRSRQVRQIFDNVDLNYLKIFGTNDLNEYKIEDLKSRSAKIDGYGVGTEMITAKPTAAIPGVYKLAEDEDGPKIKLSADKRSFPGKKQVYRIIEKGFYAYDILALEEEEIFGTPLLEKVVENGKRTRERRSLDETRAYCLNEVSKLPEHLRQVHVMKPYELRISPGLESLVTNLTEKYSHGVLAI